MLKKDINEKTIEMDKKEFALRILRYWNLIEFLGQSDFPFQNKESCKVNEQAQKSANKKVITVYDTFSLQTQGITGELETVLKKDSEKYPFHTVTSDKVDICLGKVARNDCVQYLQDKFGLPDAAAEINSSTVCFIGLKCNAKGEYIKKSFNISPLVWGIAQLEKVTSVKSGDDLANCLSLEKYQNDMKEYEYDLTCGEEGNSDDLPIFSKIIPIFQKAFKAYIQPITGLGHKMELQGVMIYQRYDSEETKAKEIESFYYSDLHKSTYTEDLQMIIGKMSSETFGTEHAIEKDLINYIVGAHAVENKSKNWIDFSNRIDIRNAWDKSNLHERDDFFNRYLDVKAAPIGKWPSKFMPAFMQQLAINLSTQPESEFGNIFSVNGPPGTGKTTLIKEVIAGNIVERAKILSEYDDPDKAFVERCFNDGDKTNKGYSKYYSTYFDFKDERIKDYGMLVTSCNNAAVENITKELPDATALLKSLTPFDDEDELVSKELNKVKNLFDYNKTECEETCHEGDTQLYEYIENQYPDIYFTKYANNLAFKKNGEWDQWGLISAPLGKYSNIKTYANRVLKPLTYDFCTSEKNEVRKTTNYKIAVEKFKEQLDKVEKMQGVISKASSARNNFLEKRDRIWQACSQLQQSIQDSRRDIININDKLNRIKLSIYQHQKSGEQAVQFIRSLQAEEKIQAERVGGIEQKVQSVNQTIKNLKKQRGLKDLLFGAIKKSTMLSKEIDEQYQLFAQEKQKASELNEQYQQLLNNIDIKMKECKQLQQELEQQVQNKVEQEESVGEHETQIQTDKQQIDSLEKEILQEQETYRKTLNCFDSITEALRKMTVLNDKFWQLYDSEDESENTQAQVQNPWFTIEYDREREKLFYLALKLHKEFILSSKACGYNLKNLLLMWRITKDDQEKIAVFSEQDKEACFSALFNTVFLLTPVLSTTFFSVGNMLSYIRKPGEIGCLIIDEAGQAQPQMALGALYRCRRAIIVGDPKQVEPVVTDEMDAIKGLMRNDYREYQSKKHSVQEFADRINPLGTYIDGMHSEKPTWVGCPLVVHRRCISPMYEISNAISYNNTMRQQTMPPKQGTDFCLESSAWINVGGTEKDSASKDHYVKTQGEKALELILRAFEKTDGIPDLFVITPFTSVKNGLINLIQTYLKDENNECKKNRMNKWLEKNIGTVHTFQGKEAAEVIFLLGCDKNAQGAVSWVNTNIVNVAVTRAKYRLYVIGDYNVWKTSTVIQKVKCIMDSHAIRALKLIADKPQDETSRVQVEKLLQQMPKSDFFELDGEIDEGLVNTFHDALSKNWADIKDLTEEEAAYYGLPREKLQSLEPTVQQMIVWSIKLCSLFELLKTQYDIADMDFSCSGVSFCKAMELQLKTCLLPAFKKYFPDFKVFNRPLEKTPPTEVTAGTFTYILGNESCRDFLIERHIQYDGYACDQAWWDIYSKNLVIFKNLRNMCCHTGKFKWQNIEELRDVLFDKEEFIKTMVGNSL